MLTNKRLENFYWEIEILIFFAFINYKGGAGMANLYVGSDSILSVVVVASDDANILCPINSYTPIPISRPAVIVNNQ